MEAENKKCFFKKNGIIFFENFLENSIFFERFEREN